MTPNDDGESLEPSNQSNPTFSVAVAPPSPRRQWRLLQDAGWLVLGLMSGGLASWLLIFSGWEIGSKAEWFSGAASFGAVAVALWQSVVIRQQAKESDAENARRFRDELKAANDRTVQEVQAAERRTEKELKAANERHSIEMEQQRDIARIQRVSLLEQEFKLALIRVSRAANAFTHELATLLAETDRIIKLPTRDERDDAIKLLAKIRNLASHDLGLEVAGSHMLTNVEQMHLAMDPIMEAALEGTIAAGRYENIVIDSRTKPNPAEVYAAMAKLQSAMGDATHLAGELLVTGWD